MCSSMPPAGRVAMGTGGALDGRVDDDPRHPGTDPRAGTATNAATTSSLPRRCKQEPRASTSVPHEPQQHKRRQAVAESTRHEREPKKSVRGRGSGATARGTWSTRICNEPGCSTVPSYGAPGTKRQFCRQHAREGMINVASKKCDMGDCGKVHSQSWTRYKLACKHFSYTKHSFSIYSLTFASLDAVYIRTMADRRQSLKLPAIRPQQEMTRPRDSLTPIDFQNQSLTAPGGNLRHSRRQARAVRCSCRGEHGRHLQPQVRDRGVPPARDVRSRGRKARALREAH